MGKKEKPEGGHSAFKAGAVSLAFLIIGYQSALFVHRAAALQILANEDHPDTVFVAVPTAEMQEGSGAPSAEKREIRRSSSRSPEARAVGRSYRRKVENFRFNPNTATVEDFQRLGFSEKQAASIVAYREKGGRFRRKSDFAKSYVVADSVYKRLEPYIDIPKTDINRADSAALDALPGIGPWFASKMVAYREALGGYSCPEQLLNIWRFDEEKYNGLRDLIVCGPSEAKLFWDWDDEALHGHPDIRNASLARAIALYRKHHPREEWTARGLLDAGVVGEEQARKLGRCEKLRD